MSNSKGWSRDHCDTKQFVFEGDDKYIDQLILAYYNRKTGVESQRYNEETGRLRDLVKLEKSKRTIEIKGK